MRSVAKAAGKLLSGRASNNAIFNIQRRNFEENAWAAQRLLKLGEKLDKTPNSALEFFSSVEEFKNTEKYPEKVQKIAMDIMKLNIIEAHQMLELIQKRMGITDEQLFGNMAGQFGIVSHSAQNIFENSGGAMGAVGGAGAAAGGAAAAAPAEEKKEEKTAFSLKLTVVDAAVKIKVIKEVRTITGLGLKEAKDLVEKAPTMIKEGLKKEEAENFKKLLIDAGAKVELL